MTLQTSEMVQNWSEMARIGTGRSFFANLTQKPKAENHAKEKRNPSKVNSLDNSTHKHSGTIRYTQSWKAVFCNLVKCVRSDTTGYWRTKIGPEVEPLVLLQTQDSEARVGGSPCVYVQTHQSFGWNILTCSHLWSRGKATHLSVNWSFYVQFNLVVETRLEPVK